MFVRKLVDFVLKHTFEIIINVLHNKEDSLELSNVMLGLRIYNHIDEFGCKYVSSHFRKLSED